MYIFYFMLLVFMVSHTRINLLKSLLLPWPLFSNSCESRCHQLFSKNLICVMLSIFFIEL